MKRYRFRLEAVARVRAVEEQLAVADLARCQVSLAAAVEAAAAAEERLRTVPAVPGPVITVADADRHRQVVAWRQEGVTLARSDVRSAEDRLEEARAAYQRAHQRVLALQRLEERARAEHLSEAARHEQAEVDQLVSDRHARQAGR